MTRESRIHDVAVVGGGVAGAATIVALAREGVTPIWIAPGPSDRPEVFGESLAPSARTVMASLGLGDVLKDPRHRASNATFSAWGSEFLVERNAAVHLEGPGLVLDREAFDSSMAHAAQQVSERRTAMLTSAAWRDGTWSLGLHGGASVESRFVVDATGRSASIGRRMVRVVTHDRMVAAVTRVSQRATDVEATRATLIEAMADGWLYAALLADGRMSLAYFSDPDLLPQGLRHDVDCWRALVAGSRHVSRWLDDAGFDIVEPPTIVAAGTRWLERAAGPSGAEGAPWVAVGDAATAMDPLSSHGLTTSLWSGARVGAAAAAWLGGDSALLDRYSLAVAAGVQGFSVEQARVYAQEQRYAARPFWSRRTSLEPKGRASASA